MDKLKYKECENCTDWKGYISHCMEICGKPLDALEEFNQYSAIGTLEECREAMKNKWIPCCNRLPENNKSVLVWLESRTIRGGHIYSIGGYQNNVWFLRSGIETESFPNLEWNVIAWMPLPEPYKEGKE